MTAEPLRAMRDDELRNALQRIAGPILAELARRGHRVHIESEGDDGTPTFGFTDGGIEVAE